MIMLFIFLLRITPNLSYNTKTLAFLGNAKILQTPISEISGILTKISPRIILHHHDGFSPLLNPDVNTTDASISKAELDQAF